MQGHSLRRKTDFPIQFVGIGDAKLSFSMVATMDTKRVSIGIPPEKAGVLSGCSGVVPQNKCNTRGKTTPLHASKQPFIIEEPVTRLEQGVVHDETSMGRVIVPTSRPESMAYEHHRRHKLREPLQGRDARWHWQIDIGDPTAGQQHYIAARTDSLDEEWPVLDRDQFAYIGLTRSAHESRVILRICWTECQTTQLVTDILGSATDQISSILRFQLA